MAVYAIADLHLSLAAEKPMDVFGDRWEGYVEKIKSAWEDTVRNEDDSIIIPGDFSWATYIEKAAADFSFLESLPGKKYIFKGNHDYWWTTAGKMKKFFAANGYKTITALNNDFVEVGDLAVCGTRGWKSPGDEGFGEEDRKLYERELIRLELSLKKAADSLSLSRKQIVVALHYPPFNKKGEFSGFSAIMKRYGVKRCIYGHMHGESLKRAITGWADGIEYMNVSADYLDFKPYLISGQ